MDATFDFAIILRLMIFLISYFAKCYEMRSVDRNQTSTLKIMMEIKRVPLFTRFTLVILYLFQASSYTAIVIVMATTEGLNAALPAAGGNTTMDNPTPPEEPWTVTAGEKYKARVWEDLRHLFQQDELTDVMLAADGQSIPCHRVLLAAASKFFHNKFVVHPESLEHNLLDIEGIEFDTLTDIVHFVYNGRVVLTLEKTEKLLPASVSLMLPELTNMCKDFLINKVEHDTSACIDIHRVAKSNSLTEITDSAWQVMLKNFQEVSKGNAFREMSQTDLQEYISDEGLNVANENPVFEAVVTWVRHNPDNRKSCFESLMENVKLSHCSTQFLGEFVKKEPLMETRKCFQDVFDAVYHHAMSSQQSGTARSGYCNTHNTLIAVCDDNVYTLKARDSEHAEWISRMSSTGKILQQSSACMTEVSIVIIGGYSNGSSRQIWQFTFPTMKWNALPDLNVARFNHATVCVGNQIYVLGGFNGGRALQSVEYLDKQNGSCQVHEVSCDIPSVLHGHTAVSYKHFIYVFGGQSSQATFMLDTVSKKWSRKADMPSYSYRLSSVVYRDRIYVLGGDQNCCMSYNPNQDQWKTYSKPAVGHVEPSAVVWKDRILLCGGVYTSVIEEYNPATDTWSQWIQQLPRSSGISPVVFAVHL